MFEWRWVTIFPVNSPVPANPKIYHIVHVDRLRSIIAENGLLCDAEMAQRSATGTVIGMNEIKTRRSWLRLTSHTDLRVGDCVPFYFCPRSVMLYVIHRANHPGLVYQGGQEPIIHLEADLRQSVAWAEGRGLRWAFTLSNAGSSYFQDRCDLADLGEIDWNAVQARSWRACKEEKQAEFLIERRSPWELINRIGVCTQRTWRRVAKLLDSTRPAVRVMPAWYY